MKNNHLKNLYSRARAHSLSSLVFGGEDEADEGAVCTERVVEDEGFAGAEAHGDHACAVPST